MRFTTLLLGLLLAFSRAGVGGCSSFRAAQPWHPHLARVRVSDGSPDLNRRAPEPLEGAPSLLQLGQNGPGCNCQGQQQAAAPPGQQGFLQAGPGLPGAPGFAQAQAPPPAAELQAAPGFFAPPPAQEAPAFVPLPDAGMAFLPAAQPGMLQYDTAAAAADAPQPPPPYAREGLGQQGELAQEALAQRQEVLQLRKQVGLMEHRMEQMEVAASRQGGQEALERAPPPQAPLQAPGAEGGAPPPLLQSPLQEGLGRPLPPQAPFQAAGAQGGAPPLLQSPLQARLPMLRQATGEGLALEQLQQMVAAQGQQLASLAGASQAAVPAGLPPLQLQQPAYAAAAEQQFLQRAAYEQQRQALQAQQLAEQAAFAQAMPQAQLLEPWGRQQPLEAMPAAAPFVLR